MLEGGLMSDGMNVPKPSEAGQEVWEWVSEILGVIVQGNFSDNFC